MDTLVVENMLRLHCSCHTEETEPCNLKKRHKNQKIVYEVAIFQTLITQKDHKQT